MTTIPPSLPPAPPAPAPQQAPVAVVPTSELPAAIASLPPSSTIDAAVALQAVAQAVAQAKAAVQLTTALGSFTARLPVQLAANATLRLLVTGTGPNIQLRVIAINGQPLPGAAAAGPAAGETAGLKLPPLAGPLAGPALGSSGVAPQPGAQARGQASGLAAQAGSGGKTIDEPPLAPGGKGIAATVVFGAEGGLKTGTQLVLRLLQIEPPSTQAKLGAPPAPASLAGRGEPETPNQSVPGAKSDVVLRGPPEPAGATEVDVAPGVTLSAAPNVAPATGTGSPGEPHLPGPAASQPGLGSATSDPTAAPVAAPAKSATLAGLVAPNSLGGKTLVQTPAGLISLNAATDFAPGTRLLLETVGPPLPPLDPPAPSAPAAAALSAQGQSGQTGWPAFGEAMAVLQKTDPPAAQLLVQRLPDIAPQLALNLVAWVAAAEANDIRAWLGDRATKALEKAGRGDLIEKLQGDLGEMRAPTNVPQAGGAWQTLTLPLFFGERVERVRLTVRRPKRDREREARDEEGLRFLLDVDMSRLGPLQFDGLLKRQAKQFDLIVRSHEALAEEVKRDIHGIFARALEGMGMTGGAVFKQAAAFVEPIPLAARRKAEVTI